MAQINPWKQRYGRRMKGAADRCALLRRLQDELDAVMLFPDGDPEDWVTRALWETRERIRLERTRTIVDLPESEYGRYLTLCGIAP